VSGRAQAWILLETAPALVRAKEIVATPGIDRVHVGLNDLHLSLRLNFMHESVAGGMLDHVAAMIAIAHQRPKFGFGGGARLSENHPVNPKDVLREHVRLGSSAIILSRTFHKDASSADELRAQMNLDEEIRSIRDVLESAATRSAAETEQDHQRTAATIWAVARQLRRRSALTIS
jgi:2-keto-3-deoxy-L-rhamnonate aldolase RhmA